MNVNFSEDGSLLGLVTGGNAVCTLKTPLGRFKGDGMFSAFVIGLCLNTLLTSSSCLDFIRFPPMECYFMLYHALIL